jgi:hypothetical protein
VKSFNPPPYFAGLPVGYSACPASPRGYTEIMTMRITKQQSIGGVSALDARKLLRRYDKMREMRDRRNNP